MDGADIIKQLSALKQLRQPLEQGWLDCYSYTYPIRGMQFGGDLNAAPEQIQSAAKAQSAKIYDGTAIDACRILASALVSGLTPANARWFDLKIDGITDKAVTDWLDNASEKIHQDIHSSNFDAPAFEGCLDIAIAGMFAMYTEEGADTPYNFELWPLYACWFAASKRNGLVDTVFYQFSLTALQAVEEYGAANVSAAINKAIEDDKPHQRFEFVQAIFPRKFEKGQKKRKKEVLQPFASYHVEVNTKHLCRDGGYHEFPLVVPRWLKIPGSVYAQGPMTDALPDTQTLNELRRLVFANLDMTIAGMFGAVDDGVMNPKTVRIGARKIIFMKSKDSFWPIQRSGDFNTASLETGNLQGSIRRIMMADQLQPQDGPAMTATEVHYRVNLIRQLLGPMYGRMQSEYLRMMVFRCFFISLRRGDLGELPDQLRDKPLRLKYVSPLARAQQLEEVAAQDRFEAALGQAATVNPAVLDVYDMDEALRDKGLLLGVKSRLIRDADKVRKIREDRSAAAAQAKQEELQTMLAMKQSAQGGQPGGAAAGMPMMGGM